MRATIQAAAALLAIAVLAGPTAAQAPSLLSTFSGSGDTLIPRQPLPELYDAKAGDIPVVEAKGSTGLYQIKPETIDHFSRYRVVARIRVLKDDPKDKGARTYVGVATYDVNGELETTPPGPHRYAGAQNVVYNSSQGWIEISGPIEHYGDTRNNFRVGTVQARPMVLLNYRSSEAVTQLEYLRLEQVR